MYAIDDFVGLIWNSTSVGRIISIHSRFEKISYLVQWFDLGYPNISEQVGLTLQLLTPTEAHLRLLAGPNLEE